MVDDDHGAFYQNKPGFPNSDKGYFGGTNVKGHLIKFNYSFTDSLTFTASCFINDLINADLAQASGGEPQSSSIHFMADLLWKF